METTDTKKPYATTSVRLPTDLHQWLLKKAAEEDRSLNGQLVSLIRQIRDNEKAGGDTRQPAHPS